jgi:hypothetical protein
VENKNGSVQETNGALLVKVIDCIKLSISDDKLPLVEKIIKRHIDEFITDDAMSDKEKLKKSIGTLVNKTLSTIEALPLTDVQYTAVRKLILNEIYGCQNYLLNAIGG